MEPRWLTAKEQEAWLAIARLMVRLPARLSGQLQRDADITHFEYMVLSGLSDAPNQTLRMSELAQLADGSLSRLSQVVTKLEKRGWVERNRSLQDRRSILATLTDEGMKVVVAAAPGHVEAVRRLIINPLSTEQLEAMRAACVAIMGNAEGDAEWFPGMDHGNRVLPGAS